MRTTAQGGFSLLEVMMAVTLFTTFTAAFMVSQGYNLADSALSEEQLKLHMLAEQRMNDLLINPPKFNNALENLKETKPFEEEGFKSSAGPSSGSASRSPTSAKSSRPRARRAPPDPRATTTATSTTALRAPATAPWKRWSSTSSSKTWRRSCGRCA